MATPDRLAFGDFVLDRSQRRLLRSDGSAVALANGMDAADVVLALVQAGLRVQEIAPQEQTLEAFYLALGQNE